MTTFQLYLIGVLSNISLMFEFVTLITLALFIVMCFMKMIDDKLCNEQFHKRFRHLLITLLICGVITIFLPSETQLLSLFEVMEQSK